MKKVFKTQVDKFHYFKRDYDSKERWASYWYQIKEVENLKPQRVLEIGVGNKTVSDYFKKIGIKVTTLDFDKSLKPDVVGNVTNLPFKNGSFDVVLCAQVLEHLSFVSFRKAISEIHRISKTYALITLPHFSVTNLYFGLKLIPFVPKKEFSLKVDLPVKHKFLGEHFWEIGKKGYSLSRIERTMEKAGFKIEKCYYPKENPRHQFFLLKKA